MKVTLQSPVIMDGDLRISLFGDVEFEMVPIVNRPEPWVVKNPVGEVVFTDYGNETVVEYRVSLRATERNEQGALVTVQGVRDGEG